MVVVVDHRRENLANDRVKTDSRDSEKFARHLSAGNLRGVHIPSREAQELARVYQRTRQQIRETRTMIGNQIKSKLFQFGWISPENDAVMSLKYLKQIKELHLPEELRYAIEILMGLWTTAHEKILELYPSPMKMPTPSCPGRLGRTGISPDRGGSPTRPMVAGDDGVCRVSSSRLGIDKQIKENNQNHPEIQRIQTVPGIGELTSNILYTELGDMRQFPNERSLYAFLGLTPCEYSSGEKQRKGHITRQGPSRLRHILVEVTWRTILKDKSLRAVYDRISAHRGGKRAIVACARKLAGRIRSCLIQQQDYRYEAIMA